MYALYVYRTFLKPKKKDLREYLGSKMDNHITWKTGDLCYTYSDGFLYIETSIKVMRW